MQADMHIQTVLCAIVLVVATISAASTTQAQDANEYEQLVNEGLSEFALGNWVEAYNLFKKAHEGAPNARTLRGMGMTSYELKEYPRALQQLRAALDSGDTPLTPELRGHVQQLIDRSRRLVGKITLTVNPPEAQVFINKERTGQREVLVPVGKITVLAELPGRPPIERVISVDGGQTYKVDLNFDARVAPPTPTPAATRTPEQPTTHNDVDLGLAAAPQGPQDNGGSLLSSPWLWVGVGVAVLGGVLAAVALSTGDEIAGSQAPVSNVGIEAMALSGGFP